MDSKVISLCPVNGINAIFLGEDNYYFYTPIIALAGMDDGLVNPLCITPYGDIDDAYILEGFVCITDEDFYDVSGRNSIHMRCQKIVEELGVEDEVYE